MATTELRAGLGRQVDAAHFRGEPTIITRNGEPRAVLVPYAWWAQTAGNTPVTRDGQEAG